MDFGWINKYQKEETPQIKAFGLFIESKMETQDKLRGGAGKALTKKNRSQWYSLQKEINDLEKKYKAMWVKHNPIYFKKYKEWLKELNEFQNKYGCKDRLTSAERERI